VTAVTFQTNVGNKLLYRLAQSAGRRLQVYIRPLLPQGRVRINNVDTRLLVIFEIRLDIPRMLVPYTVNTLNVTVTEAQACMLTAQYTYYSKLYCTGLPTVY
jgi:hypothetical protein